MWLHWSAKQISACAKDEEVQDGNRSVQFNDEVGIIAWPKSLDGFVATTVVCSPEVAQVLKLQ